MEWFRQHPGRVLVLAVLAPLAVSGVLFPLRDDLANSSAALVLVLIVVGASATANRLAGVLAALSSAVGFDFFLTRPYLDLHITSADDIELAALLLLVGLIVNEIALWGVRQHAAASQQAGFLLGVLESADLATGSTRPLDALERVAATIRRTLGVNKVSFEYGEQEAGAAVLARDGSVHCRGRDVDVAVTGLPTDTCTAIPVAQRGAQLGYFKVTATRPVRPTREQLRVAVLLAGQWSLGEIPPPSAASRRRSLPIGPPLGSPARPATTDGTRELVDN